MSNRSGATVRRWATALLVAAGLISGTANASPVHYTFNFTLQSGNVLPTSAGFDYDASAPAFTNFSVPWNGLTFNLTGSANSPIVIGSVYQTSCGLSGAALTFAFLSHAPCIEFFVSATSDIWFGQIPVSFAQPQIFAFDAISFQPGEITINATVPYGPVPPIPETSGGKWTIVAESIAVPEPASLFLFGLGALGLGWSRRRKS